MSAKNKYELYNLKNSIELLNIESYTRICYDLTGILNIILKYRKKIDLHNDPILECFKMFTYLELMNFNEIEQKINRLRNTCIEILTNARLKQVSYVSEDCRTKLKSLYKSCTLFLDYIQDPKVFSGILKKTIKYNKSNFGNKNKRYDPLHSRKYVSDSESSSSSNASSGSEASASRTKNESSERSESDSEELETQKSSRSKKKNSKLKKKTKTSAKKSRENPSAENSKELVTENGIRYVQFENESGGYCKTESGGYCKDDSNKNSVETPSNPKNSKTDADTNIMDSDIHPTYSYNSEPSDNEDDIFFGTDGYSGLY